VFDLCGICEKEIEVKDHYTDGEGDFHEACWFEWFRKEALSHGIPASVIDGKTKLKDHFSRDYIDWKCNKKAEN